MPFQFTEPRPLPRRFTDVVDDPTADYRDIHAAADAEVADLTDSLTAAFDSLANSAPENAHATESLDWQAFEATFLAATKEALTDALQTAAKASAVHLLRDVSGNGRQPPANVVNFPTFWPEPKATFVGRFDLLNPESITWIDQHAAELVRQVTAETRGAIRAIIKRSFEDGIPPADTARLLRDVIGLTERGANAVYNYEKWLRGLDASTLSQTTLDRLARGGLRKNQVAKLQRQGLSEERIQKLVSGYRQRLINERAETIARTETIQASNRGQLTLWQQAQAQGWLPATVKKVWIDTEDPRTCYVCAHAAGQKVPVDEPFSTGYGYVMTPPAHPRCRCASALTELF